MPGSDQAPFERLLLDEATRVRPTRRRSRVAAIALLVGVAACGAALTVSPRGAEASVSIAVTWDGLLRETTSAALVTPAEQRAIWENDRIYTYTRVHVDRGVAGELATGGEAWIRTMGGIVGDVGQSVDGEAVLTIGRPSLLFLHPGPTGSFEVTARAQGQFPVVADSASMLRVIRAGSVGALVKPKLRAPLVAASVSLASERLHNRLVEDAARDIASEWAKLHAR